MPRQPLRILLVEDYEPARIGLIDKLTEAGFRIAGEAGSIAVARSLAPRLAFDIALIDVYLPDGDGIEFAAELRAHDADTTIVILTLSTKPNDLLRALRVRDEHCRFPGCRQPVRRCDVDHTHDAALGGQTEIHNLAHLCRRHHTLKHATDWQVRQLGGGSLEWTSPTGLVYIDVPTPTLPFIPSGDPPPF
jgi:CheY-like chemotaxis protein